MNVDPTKLLGLFNQVIGNLKKHEYKSLEIFASNTPHQPVSSEVATVGFTAARDKTLGPLLIRKEEKEEVDEAGSHLDPLDHALDERLGDWWSPQQDDLHLMDDLHRPTALPTEERPQFSATLDAHGGAVYPCNVYRLMHLSRFLSARYQVVEGSLGLFDVEVEVRNPGNADSLDGFIQKYVADVRKLGREFRIRVEALDSCLLATRGKCKNGRHCPCRRRSGRANSVRVLYVAFEGVSPLEELNSTLRQVNRDETFDVAKLAALADAPGVMPELPDIGSLTFETRTRSGRTTGQVGVLTDGQVDELVSIVRVAFGDDRKSSDKAKQLALEMGNDDFGVTSNRVNTLVRSIKDALRTRNLYTGLKEQVKQLEAAFNNVLSDPDADFSADIRGVDLAIFNAVMDARNAAAAASSTSRPLNPVAQRAAISQAARSMGPAGRVPVSSAAAAAAAAAAPVPAPVPAPAAPVAPSVQATMARVATPEEQARFLGNLNRSTRSFLDTHNKERIERLYDQAPAATRDQTTAEAFANPDHRRAAELRQRLPKFPLGSDGDRIVKAILRDTVWCKDGPVPRGFFPGDAKTCFGRGFDTGYAAAKRVSAAAATGGRSYAMPARAVSVPAAAAAAVPSSRPTAAQKTTRP